MFLASDATMHLLVFLMPYSTTQLGHLLSLSVGKTGHLLLMFITKDLCIAALYFVHDILTDTDLVAALL